MTDRIIIAVLLILPLAVTILSLWHGYTIPAVWASGIFGFVLCGVVGMAKEPAGKASK